MFAPMFPHCVWVTAPRGSRVRLGAARRFHDAPTFPHCVWVTAPRGGRVRLGAARRRTS